MKVLQINSVCGIGSTGRIATDIHNILIEQGHESYIAYGRDLQKNCDSSIKIGTKLDNYTHVVKSRILDMHGFGSIKATKQFIKEIDKINPDIIHLHNMHGYYINIEILFDYLKKVDKPLVWTLHDCWSFTGHCSHFDYIGCDKWQNECHDCPQKKSYPSSIIIDNSRNNYKIKKELFTGLNNLTIITPSKWLADLVKKSFLKVYPIKVINTGIDLDVFKPKESSFREVYNIKDKFIILGVATAWSRNKGLDCFIKLSQIIIESEVIVMVGLTEKQLKKLPRNIIGIARTNSVKELAEIYSTVDVFINPTLSDTFPTTNLEALACGTPVITFDTGGSPESIDESCGFIVEKGNLEELKKKIRIVKDRGKSRYIEKCSQRANLDFNKNDRFKDYVNTYLDSISKEWI